MPYTVRLSAWTSIDTNLVSKLKVAISAKLHPNYKEGTQDTVGVDSTSYKFTVTGVDKENQVVSISVLILVGDDFAALPPSVSVVANQGRQATTAVEPPSRS